MEFLEERLYKENQKLLEENKELNFTIKELKMMLFRLMMENENYNFIMRKVSQAPINFSPEIMAIKDYDKKLALLTFLSYDEVYKSLLSVLSQTTELYHFAENYADCLNK